MNYCIIHDKEYLPENGCSDCFLETLYEEDLD